MSMNAALLAIFGKADYSHIAHDATVTTPATPTHSDLKQEAFATRKTHRGELSCGAHVLIDRYLLDVVPDDDRERVRKRLIAVAQRCIGAGCEPRLSPLPGQTDLVASLAAPSQADQVEDTSLPVDVPESEMLWSYLSNGYSLTHVRSCLASGIPSVEQEARIICDRVQKAWAEIRAEVGA